MSDLGAEPEAIDIKAMHSSRVSASTRAHTKARLDEAAEMRSRLLEAPQSDRVGSWAAADEARASVVACTGPREAPACARTVVEIVRRDEDVCWTSEINLNRLRRRTDA